MKSVLRSNLAIPAILLAISLSLVTLFTSYGQERPAAETHAIQDEEQITQEVTLASTVQDAENVPIYPRASNISKVKSWRENQPPEIEYDTNADVGKLMEFYKNTLLNAGWTIESEIRDQGRVYYKWLDAKKIAPYRLLLSVAIRGQHVSLLLQRAPYASRIPLLPNAQEVTVKEIVDKEGSTEKVTTFTIVAKYQEIEKFYKDSLAQYGWQIGVYENGDGSNLVGTGPITEGLHFGYFLGGMEDARFGGLVDISATGAGEQVQVRIHATGTDLSPQNEP